MKKEFKIDEIEALQRGINASKAEWERLYYLANNGLTVRSPEFRAIEKAAVYIDESKILIDSLVKFYKGIT